MKRRMVEGERAGRMWKNTEKSITFSATGLAKEI
jgi:hypothetical protein